MADKFTKTGERDGGDRVVVLGEWHDADGNLVARGEAGHTLKPGTPAANGEERQNKLRTSRAALRQIGKGSGAFASAKERDDAIRENSKALANVIGELLPDQTDAGD